MNTDTIKSAFAEGNYLFTEHAARRTLQRRISREEIEQAIVRCEIIEVYPDDKYGPSCLLLGVTDDGRVLHILVSYPPPVVKIVTVYEPDPDEWDDYRVRKV